MKTKYILPVFLGLLLTSCNKTPSDTTASEVVSETPVVSAVTSEEQSQSEEPSVTSVSSEFVMPSISDDEPLPDIPSAGEGQIGEDGVFGATVINKAIPEGWRYQSGDKSITYAEYYTDGGLKLDAVNVGIVSPHFKTAVTSVQVQGKLNSNSKAGTIATLTVFLVDTNGRTVVKAEEFPKGYGSTYNFTAMMPAGAQQFAIILTGNAGYNANLKTITVA